MSIINVKNLTFAYDGSYDNVFENVSFSIDTDWRLGFIGRNGRGKTTFLKLLTGELDHRGSITASVDFEYFPYDVKNKECFTIDVIHSVSPMAEDWEIMRELSLLNTEEDILYRQFNTLSFGERTKAMIAALFLKENSFLLIDEPTNHLDTEGRDILAKYLKKKKGFILVSHDRAFLDNCVDHILAINNTGMEIQKGNFSSWQANKELRDNFEAAENEKLKKDIKRLDAAAKRSSAWSDRTEKSKKATGGDINRGFVDRGYIGHKAEKMMKRSKSFEKRQGDLIAEKSKLLKDIEKGEALAVAPLKFHSNRLVTLSDVSVSYGEKSVFENVSLTINQGDRIAVSGKNGSGKSTLLKLICGADIPHGGTVERASNLIISYVSQNTDELCGNLGDYALSCGIDESLFKAILRKLGFSREQFEKDMADFSGGQKKKTLIARSLCERAHLYIWDEPLNFIDVISRMQIEQLIAEYKPTMIFVEHDRSFAENVSTQIYRLY